MGKLVEPQVYLVGYTTFDRDGLDAYLRDSCNEAFANDVHTARLAGISDGEILCSFYAKLCYASLTPGHNDNLTKTRDVEGNLKGCFEQGHGSVFEHCQLNFVARNVSRILTHELVRHRAGTAFSQTSGRYVRTDQVDLVFDPILESVRGEVENYLHLVEDCYRRLVVKSGVADEKDFTRKKQLTSALRRILPNGQVNEIGFSLNLRALRHIVQLRTSRHSEWEIRNVFGQVYRLVKGRFPLVFYGAREEVVDGLTEVSGMKMQPYE